MENTIQVEYIVNGLIVKRLDSDYAQKYKDFWGISGDVWPIDKYSQDIDADEVKKYQDFLDKKVFLSEQSDKYVDVCADMDFLNKYVLTCKGAGFDIKVLLCETVKELPVVSKKTFGTISDKLVFLGYDYGYPCPDYYSCINNDIHRFSEFSHLSKNRYGLLEREEDVFNFIQIRDKLREELPINKFERGEFIIYKLWEYVGDFPIGI